MTQTLLAAGLALATAAALLAAVLLILALPAGRGFTPAELRDWQARHCDQPAYATYYECTRRFTP